MFGIRQNHMIAGLMAAAIFSVNLVVLIYRPDPTADPTADAWVQYNVPARARSQPRIPEQPAPPPQCGAGTIAPLGHMIRVSGTKTRLISAFLEHRTPQQKVRVLAVVLRREKTAYRCRFCCEDGVRVTKGSRRINYDHFDYAYGTADIMCPLPPGCETPSHVTVTTTAAGSKETDREFLEVKNQQVPDSFPYNFTTCISTMYNYSNVLQLVQSLEMLQLMGVNRVVIYQTSNSPETQRVLDYYTDTGLLEVIPWPITRFLKVARGWPRITHPGDIHYYGQVPALNDCLYRYMYQTRYVAMHDIDELIIPQTVDSWSELMPLLEAKYGVNRGYAFMNYVYPDTIIKPPPYSTTLEPGCPGWQYVPGTNIMSHLYHEPTYSKSFTNNKIIVNPRFVFSASVHLLLHPFKKISMVPKKIAHMHHTRSPKRTELQPHELIFNGRMLRYSSQVNLAVHTVLMETGLLPEDALE